MHQIRFHSSHRNRLSYAILCFFDRLRHKSQTRLATMHGSVFPDSNSIDDCSIYITQVGQLDKWASFRCPGRCGKIVRLRLSSSESPRWTVATDWLGRATISPSIKQQTSCRCHFWVRRGCVHWCADTPISRRSMAKDEFNSILNSQN